MYTLLRNLAMLLLFITSVGKISGKFWLNRHPPIIYVLYKIVSFTPILLLIKWSDKTLFIRDYLSNSLNCLCSGLRDQEVKVPDVTYIMGL